ncbi:hypothetical protein [Corynebacterium sp.]|uniref:hypothetical protein n=1 Tax=Corynebacterium sp. TaxID=1720 RepID=UPI00199BFB91|nr:hypothetical protein [Corynebacterium sp.]HHU67537.1 hypothetical protein [Corynebacterium sp.]
MTRPFGERFRRQAAGGITTAGGDPFSESASFCNGWAGILGFEGGDSGSDSSNNNNNNNNNNG